MSDPELRCSKEFVQVRLCVYIRQGAVSIQDTQVMKKNSAREEIWISQKVEVGLTRRVGTKLSPISQKRQKFSYT